MEKAKVAVIIMGDVDGRAHPRFREYDLRHGSSQGVVDYRPHVRKKALEVKWGRFCIDT